MILIAHRGNTEGPCPESENRPDYLISAVAKGFYVEVDVWLQENKLFLGHDGPQYPTTLQFLSNPMFMGVVRMSTVVSFVAMSIAAYFYFRQPKVDAFSQDVVQEVKKVTWPARTNVYKSTIVVVIGVVIIAVILALFDWICASLVGLMIAT